MSMWGELHEVKQVNLKLPTTCTAGNGNLLFRRLGFTLHYDVYSYGAEEKEQWQSESLSGVNLLFDGKDVDAQEDFNEIELQYFLATRPSSDIDEFLNILEKTRAEFNGVICYQSCQCSVRKIKTNFVECVDYLLKEWGEEPGAKSLAVMIHENHQK